MQNMTLVGLSSTEKNIFINDIKTEKLYIDAEHNSTVDTWINIKTFANSITFDAHLKFICIDNIERISKYSLNVIMDIMKKSCSTTIFIMFADNLKYVNKEMYTLCPISDKDYYARY